MAYQQTDCIKNIERNFDDGLVNTKGAADKLSKWYDYREQKNKRNCLMLLFIVIVMIFTINFFKMRMN